MWYQNSQSSHQTELKLRPSDSSQCPSRHTSLDLPELWNLCLCIPVNKRDIWSGEKKLNDKWIGKKCKDLNVKYIIYYYVWCYNPIHRKPLTAVYIWKLIWFCANGFDIQTWQSLSVTDSWLPFEFSCIL